MSLYDVIQYFAIAAGAAAGGAGAWRILSPLKDAGKWLVDKAKESGKSQRDREKSIAEEHEKLRKELGKKAEKSEEKYNELLSKYNELMEKSTTRYSELEAKSSARYDDLYAKYEAEISKRRNHEEVISRMRVVFLSMRESFSAVIRAARTINANSEQQSEDAIAVGRLKEAASSLQDTVKRLTTEKEDMSPDQTGKIFIEK